MTRRWLQGALVVLAASVPLVTAAIARAQIEIDPPLPDPSSRPGAPPPASPPLVVQPPSTPPPVVQPPSTPPLVVQPPSTPPPVVQPPTAHQAATPAAPPASDDDDRTTASTKLELGGSARRLYGFGVYGLDGRAGVGSRGGTTGHFGSVGFFWGETSEHLRTYSVTAGYDFELYVAPLRFGVGVEGALLWVRRASVDARLFAPGIGAFVHGGLDLVKLGRRHGAMYLDVRLQGAIFIDNAPLWGPTLSLGFRF